MPASIIVDLCVLGSNRHRSEPAGRIRPSPLCLRRAPRHDSRCAENPPVCDDEGKARGQGVHSSFQADPEQPGSVKI